MFNETIKTVSTPEALEAAQRDYNAAKRERLVFGKRLHRSKRTLKLLGGDIENSKQYQALLLKENNALAQLEVIRKTQFENVFTEHNAARGIS